MEWNYLGYGKALVHTILNVYDLEKNVGVNTYKYDDVHYVLPG